MSLDEVPCGIVVYDEGLRIVRANTMATQLLGYTEDELRGAAVSTLFPRASLIFFNTHVHPTLSLGGRVDELYLRLRTKDGEDIPILLNGARLDEHGITRSVLTFLGMRRRELFEQELIVARQAADAAAESEKRAREQIKQAHAQLALRERLASLGTLAYGIAHEINNPLTYVAVNLELVGEELRGEGALDRRELLGLVSEASQGADRIREIVRTMGQIMRADEIPNVQVDPKGVASLVVRMTKHETRPRARVDLAIEDVPHVDGDAGRLGQVLINLVINAVQAFGDRPAQENMIRIGARTDERGWAVLEVVDNGPGVPAAIAARVFEPFFTTKAVGVGSGLGLSLSQGLVASMGGTLELHETPGGGATFRITLPPSKTQPAERTRPQPTTPDAGRRPRVLVVDDDEGVARSVARVLRRYDVTTVLSAEEALARIQRDGPFDFVFSDVRMPGQDGHALYAALRERAPALAKRIAFISGAASAEARAEFERDGVRVFTKPVEVRELMAFCDEVLPLDAASS